MASGAIDKERSGQGKPEGPYQEQKVVSREIKVNDGGGKEKGELPPPHNEAKQRGKQNRGGEAKASRAGNKSQRLNMSVEVLSKTKMDIGKSSCIGRELPQPMVNVYVEVILETQPLGYNCTRGNIYNDILTNIGLDSPTSSREIRGGGGIHTHEQGHATPKANTPIVIVPPTF